MAAIAGPIAGAVISGAMSSGGKSNSSSVKKQAFTPTNFYTPSGNVVWNGKSATATLPDDLNNLRSNYVNQAGNYNSSLSSFYGPNVSNYYHTDTNYTPKSYQDYYSQLAPSFTTTTQGSSAFPRLAGGKVISQQAYDGLVNQFGGRGSTGSSTSINQAGLDAAIQDAMSRDQQAHTSFDQAGYDAAKASFVSPEQHMYDLMRRLSQPGEDQQRTDLESRLFSQGLLGQSNGQGYNPQMQAFDNASQQAQLQRELTALTTTPDLMAKYQNLYNSAVTGAQGIDSNLLDLLKVSGNIGVGAGSNSVNAAQVQNQINQGSGNFWGSAASGIGNAVNQGVQSLFSGNTNSPFSVPFSAQSYQVPDPSAYSGNV